MKRILSSLTMLVWGGACAMAQQTVSISVENPSKLQLTAVPVVIQLNDYGVAAKSAVVKADGVEIPSQLDDLDGNGTPDELCFLTTLGRKEKKQFTIELLESGKPREYTPRVYAEMLLTNKKVKSENKQDLYISSLTVDNGTNPYWQLHHHGPAFENELVAYRIYFDHRQTVDIYGKYHRGLELRQTQFYPDSTQKAAGLGDDVLWVGQTFGLGTLRGWDGQRPLMLTDVAHRTLRILSRGPLRTIVEVIDEGWRPSPAVLHPITMTTRYTLYAGRRDCIVDVSFDRAASDLQLATGIINVKNSQEFSDCEGLRGCWGTDWPVSAKDSVGHKRETVGLGICLPAQHIVNELPADKDNYPFVICNLADELHYAITFGSDNEDFGYHSAQEWFAYLKEWKKQLGVAVKVRKK